jgi:hypothetical protein
LHEQSVCSLLAVDGVEAGLDSSSVERLVVLFSGMIGDGMDMDLRKSM